MLVTGHGVVLYAQIGEGCRAIREVDEIDARR